MMDGTLKKLGNTPAPAVERVIRRFALRAMMDETHAVTVAENAVVLGVGVKSEEPYVWIEMDDTAPTSPYALRAFVDGQSIPAGYVHVGSCTGHAHFVWHLYEAPDMDTAGLPVLIAKPIPAPVEL
jgi:hypothetical protein